MPDRKDTKRVGDIAELAVQLEATKRGYELLMPLGDRLPFDLALIVDDVTVKLQVKSAWYDRRADAHIVDTRRAKTNRKNYRIERYGEQDFHFAVAYLPALEVFYVMPIEFFNSFGGGISFVEGNKRQRAPRSAAYRDAWHLIDEHILTRTQEVTI